MTLDFEVLEASGGRKGDQGSPNKPPRSSRGALKRLPRGSVEVLWELLEVQKAPQATILETFIGFRLNGRGTCYGLEDIASSLYTSYILVTTSCMLLETIFILLYIYLYLIDMLYI